MTHWLYPANTKFYDVLAALAEPQTYWPMSSKVAVGDVLYMYLAKPYQQLAYVCEVLEVGVELDSIIEQLKPFMKNLPAASNKPFMLIRPVSSITLQDESPLSYAALKQHGLNGMLMGPRKLENNIELLNFIQGAL